MIDDYAAAEAAAVAPAVLAHVLARHRDEARSLLVVAAETWLAGGCGRYNDHETSCTAAVIGLLDGMLRERRTVGFQIAAFLETGGWTAEHLAGTADPATVPRPDIALFLGVHHDVRMTIECKRLLDPHATARHYVVDGLFRFLSGRYLADGDQATMIAYLLDRDAGLAVEQINAEITQLLDGRQVLRPAGVVGGPLSTWRSLHLLVRGGNIEASHLLIDMQARGPAHTDL